VYVSITCTHYAITALLMRLFSSSNKHSLQKIRSQHLIQINLVIDLIELDEFIEFKKFIESKKFEEKKESEWLYFNTSEYLINLFWKISSDCFICSFHLRHEHLQSSWLSLQFTHRLLFIDTMHLLMWCLSAHLKQHSSFLQDLVTWSKSKHL